MWQKINQDNGCVQSTSALFSEYFELNKKSSKNEFEIIEEIICWVPVVYHSSDGDENKFADFLEGMLKLKTKHPALIVDTAGHFKEYSTPKVVDRIWVASHSFDRDNFFQHQLTISKSSNGPRLDNVTYTIMPLSPLPNEAVDNIYKYEIKALRLAADKALKYNPIIGYSAFMPVSRDTTIYRGCKAGECPIGNLVCDAARWYADADVAFITSGGVCGPGWPAGGVAVSDIWNALPYPNTLCKGYMNGIHLFQLLNYSISIATFEGEDTDDGGRLLKVSGMRVVYNTDLDGSCIVSIDIFDKCIDDYAPIERLKLYKFATDSSLCNAYNPFPTYLGSDELTLSGEHPGKISSILYQEIIAQYMNATTGMTQPYNTTIQG